MAQALIELFSEEIPARMQKQAAADLERLMFEGLVKAGLMVPHKHSFSAPRRLGVVFDDLADATSDTREERKGPKTDAPQAAIDGFVRAAGLSSIDEARIETDPKNGSFYVADKLTNGEPTADVLARVLEHVVRNFPWPKSMRWGEGTLRWVRPLHSIICLFDGEIVPLDIDGIVAGNITRGHRFHGGADFAVKDFESYQDGLTKAHVVLDREVRKAQILADARSLCAAQNLELVEDAGLAEEVTGLVDEPHVIVGDMDPAFLDLPPEVITLSMRTHQKYFAVRDPKTGGLAPKFIVVSNVKASDGGKAIAAGNARVLSARLNDARYFWDLDRKTPLADRVAKLDTLVYHKELGSVGDKVRRMVALAAELAPHFGVDVEAAKRAATLAKADLTTGMVGEFPELQGLMGGYYAQSEGAEVAAAVRDHYKPQGPSDGLPENGLGAVVALADKLDALVSFFSIGQAPTGSGDPYALRRAALGVLRILRAHNRKLAIHSFARDDLAFQRFIVDRLRIMLRDEGARPDVLEAAFALADDVPVRMVARVEALGRFLEGADGGNLVAGLKRANNVRKAEAKKGDVPDASALDASLFLEDAERALHAAIIAAKAKIDTAGDDFDAALGALAALRAPVDGIFDAVLVNADDPALRQNRLALLASLLALAAPLADFEKLSGEK